jgi:hypothetical protein
MVKGIQDGDKASGKYTISILSEFFTLFGMLNDTLIL